MGGNILGRVALYSALKYFADASPAQQLSIVTPMPLESWLLGNFSAIKNLQKTPSLQFA